MLGKLHMGHLHTYVDSWPPYLALLPCKSVFLVKWPNMYVFK